MTEEASAAIVPVASSRTRGLEIADFLDNRMRSNHERQGKKTGAGNSAHEVGAWERCRTNRRDVRWEGGVCGTSERGSEVHQKWRTQVEVALPSRSHPAY